MLTKAQAAQVARERGLDKMISSAHTISLNETDIILSAIAAHQFARNIEISNTRAEIEATIGLDISKIYCRKTGHIIGTISDEQLEMNLLNKTSMNKTDIARYGLQTSILDRWLSIAGRDLAQLMQVDPVGYFVFAASYFAAPHAKGYTRPQTGNTTAGTGKKVYGQSFKTAEDDLAFLREKILLNAQLTAHMKDHLELIVKANLVMRDYLALVNPAWAGYALGNVDPYKKNRLVIAAGHLANFGTLENIETLIVQLPVILALIVKQEFKNVRGPYTPQHMKDLQHRTSPNASFRDQRGTTNKDITQLYTDALFGADLIGMRERMPEIARSYVPAKSEKAQRQAAERNNITSSKIVTAKNAGTISNNSAGGLGAALARMLAAKKGA